MRLLKGVVPLLVGLLTFELLLHIYDPLPFRVRGQRVILPVRQSYTIQVPEGNTKLDRTIHHVRNSVGFRGPDPPADFADRLTVLTIGGSTTECFFLNDGRTWTDAMARQLSTAFPTIWVNNGGLDGHSTWGHLVLLRQFVSTMRPKVAVFLLGVNDLGRGASNGYDNALQPDAPGWRHRVAAFVTDHSRLASMLQNLYRVGSARTQGFGHTQIDWRTTEPLAVEAAAVAQTLAEHQQRYVGAFADRVDTLVAECRKAGIEPVLVTQPTLVGEALDPTTGVDLGRAKVNGWANGLLFFQTLELYNQATREVAGRHGVLLIDLARELPKDSALYYDFIHFTNEGASAVGALIGGHLTPFLTARFPDATKHP